MNSVHENSEFVVCDVETTGLNPRTNQIIEIALVKVVNFEVVDSYSTLINPGQFIPTFITDLTGIRNEDVYNSPKFKDISYKIREFLGNAVFVAHNATFDYNFLRHEFLRNEETDFHAPLLCTKRLAKRTFPKLKKYSLESISRAMGIQNISPHRAYGDALATAHALIAMLKKNLNTGTLSESTDALRFQYSPVTKSRMLQVRKSLIDSVSNLPPNPGVYYFRDKRGYILYIGKAKNLKARVNSYFLNSGNLKKVKDIVTEAHSVDYTETGSELSAFLLEAEQIQMHKPPFNTMMKVIRNYAFIRLKKSGEYPYLEVTRKLDNPDELYFGPFNRRETAEETLEIISRGTMLRECDDKIIRKNRACYLLDIKRCLGPCVNKDIKELYDEELRLVTNFLTGNNNEIMSRLLEKMKDLAARNKFEEAAKIRDTVQAILNNIGKIKILKEPINRINAVIFIYLRNTISDVVILKEGVITFFGKAEQTEDFIYRIAFLYFTINKTTFNDPLNIEKVKIIASFLIHTRTRYEIIYTSEINSEEDLIKKLTEKVFI